jgi:TrmH family RNA methyltransferase
MIKTINSLGNNLIIETARLYDKKYRYEYKRYIVEGARMVFDAVKSGARIVDIFIDGARRDFLTELDPDKYNINIVDGRIFKKISDTQTPQGILAVVEFCPPALRPPAKNAVVLDNIQDAGNLGTIIRTCLALSINDVYLINCVDIYNPKVIRSTMSAIFFVNCYADTEQNILGILKQKNIDLICADMRGENIFKAVQKKDFALIVGNEGRGVSDSLKRACGRAYSLPMDDRSESLNAAVSAGVILYNLIHKG